MGPASGGVLPINYDWASRGDGVEIEVLHTSGSLELTGAAPAVRAPVLAPRPGATAGGEAARFSQRAVAACVDATLILAAFLISVLIQRIVAGPPDPERGLAALYLSLLAIFSIIYGALFSIFETDTIGTRRAGLKLVSLDGTPASPRDRSMRLLGKVLGIAGFGFGLVWAFVDPARLPWHDRVSRTFPVAVHRAE
jgi:uncharacterized RDD family membrane protein YckC